MRDLFNQNEAIKKDCKESFATYFNPVRCWSDGRKDTYTWVVSVDPTFRNHMVEIMGGRAYLG